MKFFERKSFQTKTLDFEKNQFFIWIDIFWLPWKMYFLQVLKNLDLKVIIICRFHSINSKYEIF